MPPQQRTDAITELLSSSPAILTDRARRRPMVLGGLGVPAALLPTRPPWSGREGRAPEPPLSDDREHRASAPDQEHRQHPCFAGDDDPDGRAPDHTPDKTEQHIANEPVAVRS